MNTAQYNRLPAVYLKIRKDGGPAREHISGVHFQKCPKFSIKIFSHAILVHVQKHFHFQTEEGRGRRKGPLNTSLQIIAAEWLYGHR